jgi:hypothetical protein
MYILAGFDLLILRYIDAMAMQLRHAAKAFSLSANMLEGFFCIFQTTKTFPTMKPGHF